MDFYANLVSEKCCVCQSTTDLDKLMINDYFGFIYCMECYKNGLTEKAMVEYFTQNQVIPCGWVGGTVKFFRESTNTIVEGKFEIQQYKYPRQLYVNMFRYNEENKKMGTVLEFFDTKSNMPANRFVSLSEIEQYNPDFKKQMEICLDLLRNDRFKISFQDLGFKE